MIRLLLSLVIVAVAAGTAVADDKATRQARKHFEKGEKLFALGRFEEALAAYEDAFEARSLPGFLFNIGQCHRNLGDLDSAIFSFKKYLKLSPEAANRESVEALIEDLEEEKAAAAEERERRALVGPGPEPPGKRDRGRPIYKKWWFWGGVAAIAGAGTGSYFLLRDSGVPDTDLGNVVFR
jgi:tetratricopeptide (TPR) repeat protein